MGRADWNELTHIWMIIRTGVCVCAMERLGSFWLQTTKMGGSYLSYRVSAIITMVTMEIQMKAQPANYILMFDWAIHPNTHYPLKWILAGFWQHVAGMVCGYFPLIVEIQTNHETISFILAMMSPVYLVLRKYETKFVCAFIMCWKTIYSSILRWIWLDSKAYHPWSGRSIYPVSSLTLQCLLRNTLWT